ncbi:mitochondrial chaperone BCS1-like protein [Dinothrombium tinctorium]|uniref:Mitochondrial chaperone BCS1 n=1 Tax=Dinothrombium tinctorium TaxID=1965070 RepID=A0A443QC05_9ACAR|nr:mitochondrial chaperone BCS1-like protein [Dinothrombium tinctorium]
MAIDQLVSSLGENPYFGAGFGLAGLGIGLASLRRAYGIAAIVFRRQCMVTLEVTCRDKSYFWLLQYITKNARNTQHIAVETQFNELETGKVETSFKFVPAVGTHFFNYKRHWIRVDRNREQQTIDLHLGIPYETVTLTTLGRSKQLFLDLLEEARNEELIKHEGKVITYTAVGSEWRQFGHPKKIRPLSSVVLDEGIADRIMNDIKEFNSLSNWYSQRGVPYRRGYLLHGPPGCGKTSYITALAGEMHYSICVLNLGDRSLTDDRLIHLMSEAPTDSIILVEDIDQAFTVREESPKTQAMYEGLNRVTFSGLTNMLDGAVSTEGRIIFMTTNHIDRLEPALIRPGRVDMIEYIGYATDHQLKKAFIKFYPQTSNLADRFVENVRLFNKPVSMAMVQGLFLRFKNEPEVMLKNVELLWRK